jgi:hypothetical protein
MNSLLKGINVLNYNKTQLNFEFLNIINIHFESIYWNFILSIIICDPEVRKLLNFRTEF